MAMVRIDRCLSYNIKLTAGQEIFFAGGTAKAYFVCWLYHPDGRKTGLVLKPEGTDETQKYSLNNTFIEAALGREKADDLCDTQCGGCALYYREEDMYSAHEGADTFCQECRDDFIFQCDYCREWHLLAVKTEAGNGDTVCASCYVDHYIACSDCDEVFREDNMITVDGNRDVCSECADSGYSYCHDCGDLYGEGNLYYDDDSDELYCDECYTRTVRGRLCHNHGYKPDPIFHKLPGETTEEYYGTEIEWESHAVPVGNLIDKIFDNGTRPDNSDKERNYYFKEDGSLQNGRELVTHPRTRASWKQYFATLNEKALQPAIEMGAIGHEVIEKSGDSRSAGIHIHSSLAAWHHKQLPRLYKLLCHVVEGAKMTAHDKEIHEDILKITQRSNYSLNRWASLRLIDLDKAKEALEQKQCPSSVSHYSGISITPHTLELRIFNSNLDIGKVRKCFEFNWALFDYTQEEQVTWRGFKKFIHDNKETYPHLYSHMVETAVQMVYDNVSELKPKKSTQVNTAPEIEEASETA